jgi:hypothetical protein
MDEFKVVFSTIIWRWSPGTIGGEGEQQPDMMDDDGA